MFADVCNKGTRALDLLHGYVMGLPVTVDFLGIYAKRAREAANEATRAGS